MTAVVLLHPAKLCLAPCVHFPVFVRIKTAAAMTGLKGATRIAQMRLFFAWVSYYCRLEDYLLAVQRNHGSLCSARPCQSVVNEPCPSVSLAFAVSMSCPAPQYDRRAVALSFLR